MVQTDAAQGSLREGFAIGIAVPKGRPIPVAYLADAARQVQAVLADGARQMAGFLAIFVTPKVHGVKVKLAPCCGMTATIRNGTRSEILAQASDGEVSLPDAMLANYADGDLVTSAPVTLIDPWVN